MLHLDRPLGGAMRSEHHSGDDPLDDMALDRLHRADFSLRVANTIQVVEERGSSCVFGLVGPWGSGKTSVLNFIRSELTAPWKVVDFNAWMVTDVESLVREFFAVIADATDSGDKAILAVLSKLANGLGLGAKVLKYVGPDFTELTEGLKEAMAKSAPLAAEHDALVGSLSDLETPILVVVDDLDRLQPEELTLVFKLIRLVGRLPHVHYLIAYDERTVLSMLDRASAAADSRGGARDYLEKMVQFRFDLPPVHRHQAWELLADRLTDTIDLFAVTMDDETQARLFSYWNLAMCCKLSTPRSIGRLVQQVESVWPLLLGEADFVDVIMLTYLRVFETELYYQIRRSKGDLVPKTASATTESAFQESWSPILRELQVAPDEASDILQLLLHLFPNAVSAGTDRKQAGDDQMSMDKRVGTAEYFDRYFQLGIVPSIDLPDSTVTQALVQFITQESGSALDTVLASAGDNTTYVVWKVVRACGAANASDAAQLVPLLASIWSVVPPKGGVLGADRAVLVGAAGELFLRASPLDADAVFSACSSKDGSLQFATDFTKHLQSPTSRSNEDKHAVERAAEAARALCSLLDDRLAEFATHELNSNELPWRTFLDRYNLGDELSAREWLWSVIDDPTSPWTLDSVLAKCVVVEYPTQPHAKVRTRHPGNTAFSIEQFLGRDRVRKRLQKMGTVEETGEFDEFDVSPANLSRYLPLK